MVVKVPTAVDVEFVVNTVAIRQVLLPIIRLSTLTHKPPNFHPYIYSPGAGKLDPLAAALGTEGLSLTPLQEF